MSTNVFIIRKNMLIFRSSNQIIQIISFTVTPKNLRMNKQSNLCNHAFETITLVPSQAATTTMIYYIPLSNIFSHQSYLIYFIKSHMAFVITQSTAPFGFNLKKIFTASNLMKYILE